MKLNLVPIGNSLGIRIPKALLQQCNLKNAVIVTVVNNTLVISAEANPRNGWTESLQKMAQNNDDKLLDKETKNAFDENEWEW